MSVFTPLERPELAAFLELYGLGRLKDFQGIADKRSYDEKRLPSQELLWVTVKNGDWTVDKP